MQQIELFKITSEQKKLTISKLIDSSSPTQSFFLVLILSALITTFGILMDNVAIIIGGMLVSPLLSPILAISMGIVMADYKLIFRSLRVLGIAVFYVVVIALLISLFIVNKELNYEIITRINPNMLYFGVALASGVAAAFAFAKEEFSERVVGVAVAIALLPPLSVMGVGIAFLNLKVLAGALSLFLVNFFGIFLGSLIVFSLLRFYPAKVIVQEELKEEERQFEKFENNHKKS